MTGHAGRQDPITTEVIRYELVSAVEEIKRLFKRTTTIDALYELNDFGMSIYDRDLNLLADAPGIPIFSGSLDYVVKACIEQVGLHNLAPGDVLTNTVSYEIGSQPIDAALLAPVFWDDEIIAYTALKAHMGELGGIDPYPTKSTDVYQEGLMMPSLWLYRKGKLVDEIVRLIKCNSRIPFLTAANFVAGAAALRAGSERVRDIARRHGARTMAAATKSIISHGERMTRQALEEIPDGEWSIVDYMDNNGVEGDPVKLSVKVRIDGSNMIVDLSDSAPQQKGPINSPYPGTVSAARYALKALTTPRLPANGGHFKPLKVIAPPGSIFHPVRPAPCFQFGASEFRLIDLIIAALGSVIPARTTGMSGGDSCPVIMVSSECDGNRGYIAGGGDVVGLGATGDGDGQNAMFLHAAAAVCNIPIEVREKSPIPVLIGRYELRQDSGGPGKFRGGLGICKDFTTLIPVTGIAGVEKTTAASAPGVAGGEAGLLNEVVFFPNTDREVMRGKHIVEMQTGETVCLKTGGGAGWGDPLTRDPSAVLEDVVEGYVSLQGADRDYGVIIEDTEAGYALAEAATARRRRSPKRNASEGAR